MLCWGMSTVLPWWTLSKCAIGVTGTGKIVKQTQGIGGVYSAAKRRGEGGKLSGCQAITLLSDDPNAKARRILCRASSPIKTRLGRLGAASRAQKGLVQGRGELERGSKHAAAELTCGRSGAMFTDLRGERDSHANSTWELHQYSRYAVYGAMSSQAVSTALRELLWYLLSVRKRCWRLRCSVGSTEEP